MLALQARIQLKEIILPILYKELNCSSTDVTGSRGECEGDGEEEGSVSGGTRHRQIHHIPRNATQKLFARKLAGSTVLSCRSVASRWPSVVR